MIEGTCSICKQPVSAEQGVHGATGDHWDCVQKQAVEVMGTEFVSGETYTARANGGWYLHQVRHGVALCGHEPKNFAGQLRAKWLRQNGEVSCPRCLAKMLSSSTTQERK